MRRREFARAALPLSMFGGEEETDDDIGPGDEMMVLGFPEGYSSNAAGFPILRSGNVASYPNAPATAYPTFLLDFHVFPGNSGGPVYVQPAGQLVGHVAGVLTQEVEPNGENLGIGIVTKARFVRETLALLDEAPKPAPAPPPEGPAALSVDTANDEAPAASPLARSRPGQVHRPREAAADRDASGRQRRVLKPAFPGRRRSQAIAGTRVRASQTSRSSTQTWRSPGPPLNSPGTTSTSVAPCFSFTRREPALAAALLRRSRVQPSSSKA